MVYIYIRLYCIPYINVCLFHKVLVQLTRDLRLGQLLHSLTYFFNIFLQCPVYNKELIDFKKRLKESLHLDGHV